MDMNKKIRPMMKMFAMITALCCCTGCMSYISWRHQSQNRANQNRYHEYVGEQAEKEQLLGTWRYCTNTFHGTKVPSQEQYTVSLFSDGTFTLLHQYWGNILFRFDREADGRWTNTNGTVTFQYSRKGAASLGALDLNQATNVFLLHDRKLKQE